MFIKGFLYYQYVFYLNVFLYMTNVLYLGKNCQLQLLNMGLTEVLRKFQVVSSEIEPFRHLKRSLPFQ